MGVVAWLSSFVSSYLFGLHLGMWGMFTALHIFYFSCTTFSPRNRRTSELVSGVLALLLASAYSASRGVISSVQYR